MQFFRSLLSGAPEAPSAPAAPAAPAAPRRNLPNSRQNKINSETDPYSRYYKPKNMPTGMLKAPSDEDAKRMDQLLNINTFERPLTKEEVNELRSYNTKYGLPPQVRYTQSVGLYKNLKRKYQTNLNYGRATRNNYNRLRRAENSFNIPAQINPPPYAPEEIVTQGGKRKRKTRKAKRKGRKGTRRA
jgi:hypothetical protein